MNTAWYTILSCWAGVVVMLAAKRAEVGRLGAFALGVVGGLAWPLTMFVILATGIQRDLFEEPDNA